MLRRMWKAIRAEESGNSLVEFAVSGGLVFTVIFSIMDGSRALYADHYVANVAREASRYAMVRGSTWSGTSCASVATNNCMATAANVTSYVQASTPTGLSTTNLTVTTTWPGTSPSGTTCMWSSAKNSPGCVVIVKVKYSFQFLIPFLPSGAIPLTSTSEVAISE